MIRRTVTRAFGRSLDLESEPAVAPVVKETPVGAKTQGIYEDLYETFRRQAGDRNRQYGKVVFDVSKSALAKAGVEFQVVGPHGRCRVAQSNSSALWIHRIEAGGCDHRSLVTHYVDDDGVPQVIEKPAERHRTSFHVTSVPKLVRQVLDDLH